LSPFVSRIGHLALMDNLKFIGVETPEIRAAGHVEEEIKFG
jgi:hypothetical protein